jgi:HEAT repeat protein
MKKTCKDPNLDELKAKKDIDGLIKALRHEDEDIRMYASIALAEMGETVVEALIKALKIEDDNLRWGVIWILSKIGKPAVEPLNKALKDEDENVRMCAQMALDMIYEEGRIFFED